MSADPAVSVIIPARDAAGTLPAALAGLAAQTFDRPFEVIVVDDGSSDDTARLARESAVGATVVAGAGEGPAKARNRGVTEARAPLLAFMDSDCEPSPEWLAAGVAALDTADLVQGAVRPPPDPRPGPFDRTIWVLSQHGLFETANLLVRRELFESLGGFESWLNPRRGIELGEDVWFGWRARRGGARIAFSAEAVVHHAVFEREPLAYVAERARVRYFPAMAARIPELRDEFFWRRWFLSRRTALFDLALVSVGLAAVKRNPLPLLATVPYLRELRSYAWRVRGGPWQPVAGVDLVADLVTLAALLSGSASSRTLLL